DIDQADQVRDLIAVGIDALILAQEADAGDALVMNVALLLRRDLALQPDKAFFRRYAVAPLADIEVGQRPGQELDRLVLVDDAPRLGKQAGRLDVGRQDLAVAVDDVGPPGGDRILRGGMPRAV